MDRQAILFGPFRPLLKRRLLLEGDRPVRLGGRAFDILTALVERPGEVVGKEQLIARVWPQTFVEEANLKIQVSALRRAPATARAAIATSSQFRGALAISLPRYDARKRCFAAPAPPVPSTTPHTRRSLQRA
jgi:hypothetical protein